MSQPTQQITADWVFPVVGAPIPGGVVEVTGSRITAVHAGPASDDALILNNAAIIPGLVNAHVHLEFSDREEPLAAGASFADWIRAVIADRRDRADAAIQHARGKDKEVVFEGIERAILSAAKKHYGNEEDLSVQIDRHSGEVSAQLNGVPIPQNEVDKLGRVASQAAKQVLIEWIRDVKGDSLHNELGSSRFQQSVRRGLTECAAAGTTTIGEIATDGWSPSLFTAETPRVVAFRELLALEPLALGDQLRIARDHLRAGREATPHWSAGLSPHAPYSVHPDLFHELCDLSAAGQAPVAFHLAETQEELELLRSGSGPLVDFFREIQFWRQGVIPPGSSPRDYLAAMRCVPHALLIHGNYLTDDDISFLSGKANFTVVYCPRTHHHFGHPPHPWRTMLDRGVRVALGTDGRATNPDLSLWNEVLFLRDRYPDVSPETLLRLATRNGAQALGLVEQTGSIAAGKSADLAVIHLGDHAGDPYAQLMHPESRPIAIMRDGIWTVRSSC